MIPGEALPNGLGKDHNNYEQNSLDTRKLLEWLWSDILKLGNRSVELYQAWSDNYIWGDNFVYNY